MGSEDNGNRIVTDIIIHNIYNIFWLFNYSKRHFYFKTNNSSFKDSYHRLKKYVNTFFNFIEEFDYPLIFNDKNKVSQDLKNILIIFHNQKHSEFEHYFSNSFNYNDEKYLCYNSILKSMPEEVAHILDLLHEITYKYGFYFWEFLIPDTINNFFDVEELLDGCIEYGDSFYTSKKDTFMKKHTRNKNESIITESWNGKNFNDDVFLKHKLLFFINPEDYSLSFNQLKQEIEIGVSKALNKSKNKIIFGDKNTAKLLFRINVNSKFFTKNDLLKTIMYEMDGYRSLHTLPVDQSSISILNILPIDEINDDPYLIKLKKERNAQVKKDIDHFKKSSIGPYEQRSSISRLIGIWLWDKVHSNDKRISLADAMREIQKKNLPAEYNIPHDHEPQNKDSIERMLRKEYELACKCIDAYDVLNLTERKK